MNHYAIATAPFIAFSFVFIFVFDAGSQRGLLKETCNLLITINWPLSTMDLSASPHWYYNCAPCLDCLKVGSGGHTHLFKASTLQNESPSQLPRKLRGFTSRSLFIMKGSSSGRDWRQKPQRNTAHWLVRGFKTITHLLCLVLFIHTHSTTGN